MNNAISTSFEDLFERVLALEAYIEGHKPTMALDEPYSEYFSDIWAAWPIKREDGKTAKGNRAKAYRAFKNCISKKYTPIVLTEAAGHYLVDVPNRGGYVQQVATFFGRNRQTWREYADNIILGGTE